MPITFTTTAEITEQQLADLMVTALEGGSNYWIDRVEPVFESHQAYSTPEAYDPGMIERAFRAEDDDTPYKFNRATIATGLQTMATVYPHHFADVIQDNVDATTADVFLQCVLFGELVYG